MTTLNFTTKERVKELLTFGGSATAQAQYDDLLDTLIVAVSGEADQLIGPRSLIVDPYSQVFDVQDRPRFRLSRWPIDPVADIDVFYDPTGEFAADTELDESLYVVYRDRGQVKMRTALAEAPAALKITAKAGIAADTTAFLLTDDGIILGNAITMQVAHYFERRKELGLVEARIEGSSFIKLARPANWLDPVRQIVRRKGRMTD